MVLSDSNGHFHFQDLCPGTYTLVCDHIQCEHLEQEHELYHATWIDVEATDKYMQVETINIRGERNAATPTQSVNRLNGQALAQTRGSSLGDVISSLPGVNRLQTGATISKPIIHGLHSNRVLILNNGIRQEAQQWGSEHAPEIDPFLATQISVIKGAGTVKYGSDAVAGVILVEPAQLRDSAGIGGQIHLGGFSNGRQGYLSGMLEGNLTGHRAWSWRIQGTEKRGGNLHTPNYFLENTGLSERNGSAAVAYRTQRKGAELFFSRFGSELGVLSSAHVGSLSDWERALASPIPLGADTVGFSYQIGRPYQQVVHDLMKWKGYYRIADAGKLTATYAYQRNRRLEYDKHQPRGVDDSGKDKAELTYLIQTHSLETSWQHNPIRGFTGEWGLFGLYQNNVLRGRPFIPNFVMFGGDAYGIERWKQGRWEVEAGLRYGYRWIHSAREEQGKDIFTIRSYQSMSGMLGAIVDVNEQLKLNLNTGSAWRPPHVNELFSDGLHHGAAAVEIGDSTLTPEQAWKSIATLSYRNGKHWQAEVSAFHQHFWNFIYKKPDGVERTIRGTFPRLIYAQTSARLMGIDAMLAYRSDWGLAGEAKASYLHTHNLNDGQPLIYMPANWGEFNIAWHFKGTSQLSESFVQLGTRHVMEQTQVPIARTVEEADFLPPPHAYTLWHIKASTRLQLGTSQLRISGNIDNLFNVQYRDYLDRFRYFADAIGRNYSLKFTLLF